MAARIGIAIADRNGAGGTSSIGLTLTSTGSAACTLQGYPGVAALDNDGRQILQAARVPGGYQNGQPIPAGTAQLVVRPAHAAYADLRWQDTSSSTSNVCRAVHSILVTPPNTTKSTRLVVSTPDSVPVICARFDISPVTAAR